MTMAEQPQPATPMQQDSAEVSNGVDSDAGKRSF